MESLQHGLIVTDTVTYRAVGILHVQHRPQGLVHHVDDIKGTGIAVKVDIYFLVFARLLTAVLMQQLVAVFQRASGQQQAALFLWSFMYASTDTISNVHWPLATSGSSASNVMAISIVRFMAVPPFCHFGMSVRFLPSGHGTLPRVSAYDPRPYRVPVAHPSVRR